MEYKEINNFDIDIRIWRVNGNVELRQLSIFCHAGWYENRDWLVNTPSMLCYYTEHDVPLLTEPAISHTIARNHTILRVKEVIAGGSTTYDYSLKPNERDGDVEAYWQAAAGASIIDDAPADILLVTGYKNQHAERKSDRLYRLSDVFSALADKGLAYDLIRFYGCRSISNDETK